MITQNTPRLLVLIALLALCSCAKEVDQFIPDPINLDFEQEFGLAATAQNYTIDGRKDTIIFTPRGTEFEIDQHIFVFENGDECPCESIELQIIEYNRAGDFIIDPTISGTPENLIAVEGLYWVTGKSDGKKIDLKSNVELHYHDPSNLDLGYGLLYGDGPESWNRADQLPGRSGRVEFSSSIDGYEVYIDQLGWSGIGKDLSYLGTTHVCVDLDLLTHDKNAEVYAIGTTKLLVKPLSFDIEKECFCGELPLDIDVDIVVVRKNSDDEYQFAQQSAKVTTDLELHMEYQPETKTQMQISALLQAL